MTFCRWFVSSCRFSRFLQQHVSLRSPLSLLLHKDPALSGTNQTPRDHGPSQVGFPLRLIERPSPVGMVPLGSLDGKDPPFLNLNHNPPPANVPSGRQDRPNAQVGTHPDPSPK